MRKVGIADAVGAAVPKRACIARRGGYDLAFLDRGTGAHIIAAIIAGIAKLASSKTIPHFMRGTCLIAGRSAGAAFNPADDLANFVIGEPDIAAEIITNGRAGYAALCVLIADCFVKYFVRTIGVIVS